MLAIGYLKITVTSLVHGLDADDAVFVCQGWRLGQYKISISKISFLHTSYRVVLDWILRTEAIQRR